MERKIHRLLALVSCILLGGCSFFSRQPPLPRHAAIEAKNAGDEAFSALIRNADIIYFPSESVLLAARSEAAWKLLQALQRNGGSFAFGWDSISGEEQPLLEEWANRPAPREKAMPRLHLQAAAGGEESSRIFLQEADDAGAHILALRSSLPAQSSEEFAAARIAEYFQHHRNEKMLVFFRREQLGRTHGVPLIVAQKTQARQLVINVPDGPPSRLRLLAGD